MLENFSIKDEQEFFIFGEPIDTPYGEIRFYSFKEYQKRSRELAIVSFSTLKIYYLLVEFLKKHKAKKSDLKELRTMKKMDLYDFIRMSYLQGDRSYLEAYMTVFDELITNENIKDFKNPDIYFEHMAHEQFYELRDIIMRMNILKEEKMAHDEKVQEYLDKSKRFKNQGKEAPTTETILSSIFVNTGVEYSKLTQMTAYQVMSTYTRIHALKDFEISSLFATVSGEVTLEAWDRNNDFFKEEEFGLDLSAMKKNFEEMLG